MSKAMESSRQQSELQQVHLFLEALRNEKAAYGPSECMKMAKMGAVDTLIISENFMKETEGKGAIKFLMKKVETMDGEVQFVSSDVSSKKIDSLGGVVAILRWKA